MNPIASIIITTRNRCGELRHAIASSLAQDAPVEVIVIDDASTDGTTEMVKTEFPAARIFRVEEATGYIVQRNRAAHLATTPYLIYIDDDAVFPSASTVRKTIEEFDHPRIGAIAIPYTDETMGPGIFQRAPAEDGIYAASQFRGTAHALRRDVFISLGGFREFFFHQNEETEYCIRLLNAGYITRLGCAEPIDHRPSPVRSYERMYRCQTRNSLLYAWYNAPSAYLIPQLVVTTGNQLLWGIREGYARAVFTGVWQGYTGMIKEKKHRAPVTKTTYKLFRKLRYSGPTPLGQFESQMEPAKAFS